MLMWSSPLVLQGTSVIFCLINYVESNQKELSQTAIETR